MKSRKWVKMIAIAMIIASFALILVGCRKENSGNDNDGISPGQAFAEVVEKLMHSMHIDKSEPFSVEFSTDIHLMSNDNAEHKMKLNFAGDMFSGADGTNADNTFLLELMSDNGTKYIGMYADGENLYLDSPSSKYKIINFKIYDLMHGKKRTRNISIVDISMVIGELLFSKVNINGGTYEFDYDLNSFTALATEVLSGTLGGDEGLDAIAKSLGYTDWNALEEPLQKINGKLKFNFVGNQIFGVSLDNNTGKGKQKLSAKGISVKNGKLENSVINRMPADLENYTETKIMNFNTSGNFELIGNNGIIGKYNWKFVSNLDLFELISNDGDFNMDEDDMAHFIVSANMDESSSAYNNSKIKASDGVILEMAYSPKEFGNKNVFLTANIKAIMPKQFLTDMGLPSIVTGIIPKFYGAHIDVDILSNIANIGAQTPIPEGGSSRSIVKESMKLSEILSLFKLTKGKLELDRRLIDLALGGNDSKIDYFLDFGEEKTTALRLNINSFKFGDPLVEEYEVMSHFLYSSNDGDDIPKDFGKLSGFTPAKKTTPLGNNGYVTFVTKDGKTINENGVASEISVYEANGIVGGNVAYNYIDFYGNEGGNTQVTKILGVSPIDFTKIGEEQEINLITSVTDGYNLISLLGNMNIYLDLPLNVYKTKIILCEEQSSQFTPEKILEFKVGDELTEDSLKASLKVNYNDDTSYIYNAMPIDYNIPLNVIEGKKYFAKEGEYNIKYVVAGREISRTVKVMP